MKKTKSSKGEPTDVRERRGAHAWQSKDALRLMRDCFKGNALVTTRTLYFALTEIVSDQASGGVVDTKDVFGRAKAILTYSGLTYAAYLSARRALEFLELIDVEITHDDKGHRSGTIITLLEPNRDIGKAMSGKITKLKNLRLILESQVGESVRHKDLEGEAGKGLEMLLEGATKQAPSKSSITANTTPEESSNDKPMDNQEKAVSSPKQQPPKKKKSRAPFKFSGSVSGYFQFPDLSYEEKQKKLIRDRATLSFNQMQKILGDILIQNKPNARQFLIAAGGIGPVYGAIGYMLKRYPLEYLLHSFTGRRIPFEPGKKWNMYLYGTVENRYAFWSADQEVARSQKVKQEQAEYEDDLGQMIKEMGDGKWQQK